MTIPKVRQIGGVLNALFVWRRKHIWVPWNVGMCSVLCKSEQFVSFDMLSHDRSQLYKRGRWVWPTLPYLSARRREERYTTHISRGNLRTSQFCRVKGCRDVRMTAYCMFNSLYKYSCTILRFCDSQLQGKSVKRRCQVTYPIFQSPRPSPKEQYNNILSSHIANAGFGASLRVLSIPKRVFLFHRITTAWAWTWAPVPPSCSYCEFRLETLCHAKSWYCPHYCWDNYRFNCSRHSNRCIGWSARTTNNSSICTKAPTNRE